MTTYQLVRDYRPAHEFLRKHGVKAKLHFPTISAIEDGQVVGLLSNRGLGNKGVWLGPFVIEEGRTFVAYRLIDVMDRLLLAAGVTRYFFAMDPENPLVPQVLRSALVKQLPDDEVTGEFVFMRDADEKANPPPVPPRRMRGNGSNVNGSDRPDEGGEVQDLPSDVGPSGEPAGEPLLAQ